MHGGKRKKEKENNNNQKACLSRAEGSGGFPKSGSVAVHLRTGSGAGSAAVSPQCRGRVAAVRRNSWEHFSLEGALNRCRSRRGWGTLCGCELWERPAKGAFAQSVLHHVLSECELSCELGSAAWDDPRGACSSGSTGCLI